MNNLLQNTANPEGFINSMFNAVNNAALICEDKDNNSLVSLNFYYFGGEFVDKNGVQQIILNGFILLTASATNYIELNRTTSLIQTNTTGFTSDNIPLFLVTTDLTKKTSIIEKRVFSLSLNNIPFVNTIGISPIQSGYKLSSSNNLVLNIDPIVAPPPYEVITMIQTSNILANGPFTLTANATRWFGVAYNNVNLVSNTTRLSTYLYYVYKCTTDATKITSISDIRFSTGMRRGGNLAFQQLSTITLNSVISVNYVNTIELGVDGLDNCLFTLNLKCKVAEFGYAVDDEVVVNTTDGSANGQLISKFIDTTSLNAVIGSSLTVTRRDATFIGTIGTVNIANWDLLFKLVPIL